MQTVREQRTLRIFAVGATVSAVGGVVGVVVVEGGVGVVGGVAASGVTRTEPDAAWAEPRRPMATTRQLTAWPTSPLPSVNVAPSSTGTPSMRHSIDAV